MRIGNSRRSDQFEDRGQGGGGGGGGGLGPQLLFRVVRVLGFKGTLVAGVVVAGIYLVAPSGVKNAMSQALGGGNATATRIAGPGACEASESNRAACDFSRVVLASTEDVWKGKFAQGELPGGSSGAYELPTLVVFTDNVNTGGCGSASSASGPFYCPADNKLYLDPTFYQTMATNLKAPGDFAQAYVIAHEVGHHVQNLIGSSRRQLPGETSNQTSVRVELQADCFSGVWGHAARSNLDITEEDLGEALGAAHAIGDDALGHTDASKFTHGSSAQRLRWFQRGFQSGDARTCDTFAEEDYTRL